MSITLDAELEATVNDLAQQQGKTPEQVVREVLRGQLIKATPVLVPQDEWERQLLSAASDCGVSLSNEALSRESIYD